MQAHYNCSANVLSLFHVDVMWLKFVSGGMHCERCHATLGLAFSFACTCLHVSTRTSVLFKLNFYLKKGVCTRVILEHQACLLICILGWVVGFRPE